MPIYIRVDFDTDDFDADDFQISDIALDRIRRYRASRHIAYGIHTIPAIPDAGQTVDEEAYNFHRPEYFIQARVTENLRKKIERFYEDQSAASFDDTITTDVVQMANYRYNHQMGYNQHMVTMILGGSNT